MTDTIIVNGNKTLGAGDDGNLQCVEAAAIITFPHENTHKFVKEDEFEITSNTTAAVSLAGETGVTLSSSPTIAKGTGVKVKYQGSNTYLIWVCLIILVGFGMLTYNDTMRIIEDGIISINHNGK